MEAESYANDEISTFINNSFIPVEIHIKEHPAWFHRFDAVWTPTIIVMDENGVERVRNEGYLPREEFRAWLENALGRLAFMHKEWGEAEERYSEVVAKYPNTHAAPEAIYWRGISRYKASQDHTVLAPVAKELKEKYPDSIWTVKASAWA